MASIMGPPAPATNASLPALDTTTSGRSSEPDMNVLAVIAWGARRGLVVSTITPVAKRPSAARKRRSANARGTSAAR
jgi:hypothetical protein